MMLAAVLCFPFFVLGAFAMWQNMRAVLVAQKEVHQLELGQMHKKISSLESFIKSRPGVFN